VLLPPPHPHWTSQSASSRRSRHFPFSCFFMVDVSYGVLARNLHVLPLCDSRKNYTVGPSVSLNAKQEKVLAIVCYSWWPR
jgi:hypothetical protein